MLLKMGKTALYLLILFVCLSGIVHAAGPDITTHVFGGKKVALDASTDTVKAGYYSATTLHDVDPALKSENIAVSTAIFGVAGTYTGTGLPKTGQYMIYHGSSTDGHDLGDDGMARKGLPASGPRFTDNKNGTITDNATGLMWKKCSLGQTDNESCDGPATPYNWDFDYSGDVEHPYAFTACADLNAAHYAGYSDWRLPNVKELMSIEDYSSEYYVDEEPHSINTVAFPNTQDDYYWSSNIYAPWDAFIWVVNFTHVLIGGRTGDVLSYVRCIRGGP